MVIVRLVRYGRKRYPFYKIYISDRRRSCRGKFIEKIGFFNPLLKKNEKNSIYINITSLENWLKKGACLSKRIFYLYKNYKKNENKKIT